MIYHHVIFALSLSCLTDFKFWIWRRLVKIVKLYVLLDLALQLSLIWSLVVGVIMRQLYVERNCLSLSFRVWTSWVRSFFLYLKLYFIFNCIVSIQIVVGIKYEWKSYSIVNLHHLISRPIKSKSVQLYCQNFWCCH